MSIVTKNRHLEREIFVFSILFYNPSRVSRGTIFPVIYKLSIGRLNLKFGIVYEFKKSHKSSVA